MQLSISKEFVFSGSKETPSCHASTILPPDNGEIVAAWFAGTREKNPDVRIYCSVRNAAGTWSRPKQVGDNENTAHWNPVLHKRTDGTVILYYKCGAAIADWITKYVFSTDGGKTWSESAVLVPGDTSGGRGPVKNKCLRLSDGTLLAPASTEQNRKWIPFVDISNDDGISWIKHGEMPRTKYRGAYVGLIQPTLWQDKNGDVHCFLRSNKGAVYKSDSADGGVTWCKPYRTRLPNNNSGIDCVRDKKGKIWLVYNPVGENRGARYPLVLACSDDNGLHFEKTAELESEPGEYSYPAIVCKDNKLYITYTYNREKIAFAEIII